MAKILVVSSPADAGQLTALSLLPHVFQTISFDAGQLAAADGYDLLLLDGRGDLVAARGMARILQAVGGARPVLLMVRESALATITEEWGIRDFVLDTAGPNELEARIRLSLNRTDSEHHAAVSATGLTIDVDSFTARINGKALDLTFKEFELLRYLVDNPGRVFSRDQLLSEVWGYDYFGGTRTVDVHIRRLRSKLGELESLIGTVRNVGYRLNRPGLDD